MNTQVLPQTTTLATEEPCVVLDGVSWEQYDALVRVFIDRFPALPAKPYVFDGFKFIYKWFIIRL
ncbi:MAG: hypothetical protein F6J93_16275 [Oscillatoria sp. SIO1A7]|nr:hypothetical protein [Oscillatoria sp. SIO1A7]